MGLIFNDERDEQQQAMMQTTAIGLTWQYRYLTIKWAVYCAAASIGSFAAAAITDYTIVRTSDYEGLIDWALSKLTGN
jgi:hypothetical protein|tara:strand:+ start:2881 stop:3114 length:234 start_codon:yes stop_codon:yes gene_type:complete